MNIKRKVNKSFELAHLQLKVRRRMFLTSFLILVVSCSFLASGNDILESIGIPLFYFTFIFLIISGIIYSTWVYTSHHLASMIL